MPHLSSSAISHADYDAKRSLLYLWFRDDRSPYIYRDVPQHVFDGLMAAQSKGQYFHEHILDRYAFRHPD